MVDCRDVAGTKAPKIEFGILASNQSELAMYADNAPLLRAFQLAQSGRFSTLDGVLQALKDEGYAIAQVNGPAMRKQLQSIIDSERAKRAHGPEADNSLHGKTTR
jgi:hypothetical protein